MRLSEAGLISGMLDTDINSTNGKAPMKEPAFEQVYEFA